MFTFLVSREALDDIFDVCDLDGNGLMSRDEFNWFNIRTSGEEVADEEWEVVEGEGSEYLDSFFFQGMCS